MENTNFKLNDISLQFDNIVVSVKEILSNDEKLIEHKHNIEQELDRFKEQKLIKVAFVGQYSAGKSTIISALTNNKSIKIDADIATDETTSYKWNNILLTDTPGLYTDRPEHDKITLKEIKHSDLLVFVITSDLFDDITIRNFIDLAYTKGYKNKMLFVINKMLMEDGEYDTLKKNYTETLTKTLKPHNFNNFKSSFIDAYLYTTGVDKNMSDLIELSHFDNFINNLNNFVAEKGILAKFETPFIFVKSEIENAIIQIDSSLKEDISFKILERIEKRIIRNMRLSLADTERHINNLRMKILEKGRHFSSLVGQKEEIFNEEQEKIEGFLSEQSDIVSVEIENSLKDRQDELKDDIQEIFDGNLGEYYFEKIKTKMSIDGADLKDNSKAFENFNTINNITSKISGQIIDLTGAKGIGFSAAKQVAGSEGHKIVYNVGKFFGAKFKPYGAVNIAKYIGNFAKVLGPVLGVISVFLEGKEMYDKAENERKIASCKEQIFIEFTSIADDIEKQIIQQYNKYKETAFTSLLNEIANHRENAINNSDKLTTEQKELKRQSEKLERLQNEIHE